MNRKTDYALAALADMARNGHDAASARDLSERLRLPLRALTNTLNHLTHEGLVISVRGVQGGYRLAKRPREITLTELIEAVEGPFRFTRCSVPPNPSRRPCNRSDLCEVSKSMKKVHATLRRSLSRVTLEHIAWNTVPLDGTAGPAEA